MVYTSCDGSLHFAFLFAQAMRFHHPSWKAIAFPRQIVSLLKRSYTSSLHYVEKYLNRQESIPVGCVPPSCQPYVVGDHHQALVQVPGPMVYPSPTLPLDIHLGYTHPLWTYPRDIPTPFWTYPIPLLMTPTGLL